MPRSRQRTLALASVFAVCATGAPPSTTPALPTVRGSSARFTISDNIVVASPSRFGLNLDSPSMTHWAEEPFHNQWWGATNPNPIEARVKLVATGGGADFIEADVENNGKRVGAGMGYHDVFRDGFFDGGDVWVWRYQGNRAVYVRHSKILKFQASKTGPNRITLEPGAAIEAGDEFIMRTVRRDLSGGVTRTFEENGDIFGRLALQDRNAFVAAGGKVDIAPDAPPGGGGGSLRILVPAKCAPVSVGSCLISNGSPDWPRFKEGAPYQLTFWAKQQGLSAPLHVQIASMGQSDVNVTGEWAKYTISFTGAPPKGTENLNFTINSSGTVQLDNIFIHEIGATPPGAYYPEVVDTLKRFHPSSIRIWTLQCNHGFGRSLDAGLGPIAEANLEFSERSGGVSTRDVDLYHNLDLCARVGADPWIIVSTQFSPEEYRNLIEYLAGGPETPYGRKRAERGRVEPWTKAFNKISVELGNETWNGSFAPQAFAGRAKEYGEYGELVFSTMKSSPSFDSNKFDFVLNGWVAGTNRKGYGPVAFDNCPSATASDMAYYTGGWDAVGLIKADSPQWGWFNILTYSYRMLRPRSEECAKVVREIAAEQHRPVSMRVYEAGPGYTLPGPGKFDIVEQREGKSMAQAVNSLDIFMLNLQNGFGDQAFFLFRNSHYWSSHNRKWGEHIVWKALALRNNQIKGQLITATPTDMVSVDVPEASADVVSQSNSADKRTRKFPAVPNLPLVACYPFKDGSHYSYMLYSRRLDAPTPVTLQLPYDPNPEMRLYWLSAADPSVHNIDSEAVQVREEIRRDAARNLSLTLPPYSIVVVTNDAR